MKKKRSVCYSPNRINRCVIHTWDKHYSAISSKVYPSCCQNACQKACFLFELPKLRPINYFKAVNTIESFG